MKLINRDSIVCRFRSVLMACMCLFVLPAFSANTETASFPLIEDYLLNGKVAEYLKEATAYLESNSSSKVAPRVAFDILMVAERLKNKNLSNQIKAILIFEYSQSIQGSYVLSSFKDAKEFRTFILSQAGLRLKKDPSSLPRKFTRVVINGLGYFKMELLEDRYFLLKAYCLAEAAEDEKVVGLLRSALTKEPSKKDAFDATMKICLDQTTDVAVKISNLHGKDKDAAFIEKFYLSTLSSDERKAPAIIRILAENAINAQDYEAAQLLINEMPLKDQSDPQILFWKGWALLAQKKDMDAVAVFGEITKLHPDNEWSKSAEMYIDGVRNITESQEANAITMLAVSKELREGIGVLQTTVRYEHEPKSGELEKFSLYIGMVPDSNHLELMLYKNNTLLIAYRTTDLVSSFYLKSDNKILTFNTPGPTPAPLLALSRDSDGKFSFTGNLAMETSIKKAGAKSSSLFDSPYLSTQTGVQILLDYMTRNKGWVPNKPLIKKGMTSYVWQIPSADSSTMELLEYRISEKSTLSHINFGSVRIEEIKYGAKDSFKLTPPPWPECPVEKHAKFGADVMVKVMGAVMSLLETK